MFRLATLRAERLVKGKVDVTFLFFFAGIMVAVFGLQLSGLSIGRWGLDARAHIIAVEWSGAGATSLADHVVALLTPYFRIGPFYNALPTIGIVYVIARIAYQARLLEKLVILFLSFPLIFQLQFVSKEAIITLFIISLYMAFSVVHSSKLRLLIGFGGLLIMATTFRQYYLISVAFGLCIFFIRRKDLLGPALVAGLVTASLVETIRVPLLTARYYVYYGVSVFAASKTPLLLTGKGPTDFVGNYFTSLFFYLFPIALNLRVQEIYMQIYMILLLLSIGEALTKGERTLASIFLGIILTLPVFVPDVGTLSRHLSAIVPLLFMSLYFSRHVEVLRPSRSRGRNAPQQFLRSPLRGDIGA
ncbi:MAG: hypothetical protein K8R18_05745 [Parvibaculum sp.]|uniref:hypothetical protein n=1 Tax=Parvibaculum sp. TaxID=2024848 RepID=UPI0025D75521|nr:hypothetical protein [Parvibaculum sp.]MCE9649115.1 hypothetical protein [Parvibaculum sp.]